MMTFISYAQNYEDVMLNRALKDINKGVYIDVGANDPVADSVTKSFYDLGWRGINIEPIREYYERLASDRPEDVNLPIAISSEAGLLRMFDILDTGLSTFDEGIALTHAKNGHKLEEIYVPCLTLNSVLAVFQRSEIHFLKVDVEGAEKEVLASVDLTRYRPWVILCEATRPCSQESNYKDWEPILLSCDYQFVYFDGLNRFYVANEHLELLDAFRSPPNVFDGFTPIAQVEADTRNKAAEARAQQAEMRVQQIEAKTQAAVKAAEIRANEAESLLRATSLGRLWRSTHPLRASGFYAAAAARRLPRRLLRWLVLATMPSVLKSTFLRKFFARGLNVAPRTKQRLRAFAIARGWLSDAERLAQERDMLVASQAAALHLRDDINPDDLSTTALVIYKRLNGVLSQKFNAS